MAPKPKRRKWPWVLGGLVTVFVVLAVIGAATSPTKDTAMTAATASGTGTPKSAAPKATSTTTGKPAPPGVGTAVKTGDFQVTVVSVNDPFTPANEFEKAQSGNRIVRVELNVANTSSDQQEFSTLAGLNIRDSTGGTYHIDFFGGDGPSVDGPVPAKGFNHGFETFEVPVDATGLQLQVQGDLFGDAKLINLG